MDVDDSLNMNFPADVGDLDAEESLSINFNWTVDQEILLFEAMMGHKPVGVDKNIHMICITRKMNQKWRLISKSAFITPQHIWAKLSSMYDLRALDESECVPECFPEKNEDFVLPSEDFGLLMSGLPTNSNDTSRSSTVDREVDDDSKNNDSAVKDEIPIEDSQSDTAATTTTTSPSASASAAPTTEAAATAFSATPMTASTPVASSSSSSSSATAAATPVTPSGPAATSTPTSKPGRKRSKAAAASQSEDKTPSGPSSAKRTRR